MLIGYPTKRGTGVIIYGDYLYLTNLYDIIYTIDKTLNSPREGHRAQANLLMNFAYEIRKAKDGSRKKKKMIIGDEEITYLGAEFVWPDILIFSNVLRDNAGYCSLDKWEQSFIYMFEYCIENSLMKYDEVGGNILKTLVGRGLDTSQKYMWQLYQTIHYQFISDAPGKKRYRKLYELLTETLFFISDRHKNIMAGYKESAILHNCAIEDLQIEDYPEIIW